MDLRPVGPEHREVLSEFECRVDGLPCTLVVEEEIRQNVAGQLANGWVEALGSWDGDELVSVAVFVERSGVIKLDHLATRRDRRRRKQAHRLVLELVDRATASGGFLACHVHIANRPMMALLLDKFVCGVDPPAPRNEYQVWTVVRPRGT